MVPRTKAGKALAIRLKAYYPPDEYESWEVWIEAIEKEAVDNEIRATMERFKAEGKAYFAGDIDPWNHGEAV